MHILIQNYPTMYAWNSLMYKGSLNSFFFIFDSCMHDCMLWLMQDRNIWNLNYSYADRFMQFSLLSFDDRHSWRICRTSMQNRYMHECFTKEYADNLLNSSIQHELKTMREFERIPCLLTPFFFFTFFSHLDLRQSSFVSDLELTWTCLRHEP